MILKRIATTVMCFVGFIEGIHCASYSRVYVQSGADYPYYSYGAPAVTYGSQMSRLAQSPVGSVVPLQQAASFVPPCVPAPCIPTQPIAPVTNAGLVAYKAPTPVVVTRDEPSAYEYSYVVYDESTGDQKTLKELSDGLVVRGQYSLLQPDGYVREVQYTADDLTGFNAVVRKFLPQGEIKTIEIKPAKDCGEKQEALKEEPHPEADGHGPGSEASHGPVVGHEPEVAHSPEDGHGPADKKAPPQELHKEPAEVVEPHGEAPAPEAHGGQEKPKEEQRPHPAPEQHETAVEPSVPTTQVERVDIKTVQPLPQGVIIENPPPISYSTYNQLMKCIQAMKNSEQQRMNSPLSYILLPSNSLPC